MFLQFELLRKRSLLERRSRSITERLKRAERGFLAGLESLVAPALTRTEGRGRDLEYEVLSDACSRYEVSINYRFLVFVSYHRRTAPMLNF